MVAVSQIAYASYLFAKIVHYIIMIVIMPSICLPTSRRTYPTQLDFECKVVAKIFVRAIQTGIKNALK